MTKDLTSIFYSVYEQSHSSSDDEKNYLIECDEPFSQKKLPMHMDRFLKKVTNLHQRIELMKTLIHELGLKQDKILTESIPDKVLHEEHDQLIKTIKETSEYLNKDIRQMKNDSFSFNNNGAITTEERIKRDQVNVLVVLFQDIMVEYNNVQLNHRDKCKARIKRQLGITSTVLGNEELEQMIEEGNMEVFHKQIAFDDISKGGKSLRVVENRHADILQLERAIKDLAEIFQDVAFLVESQGDMIDNIERNVDETLKTVTEAKKILKRATRYKSRSVFSFCCPTFLRKTMCCTIL